MEDHQHSKLHVARVYLTERAKASTSTRGCYSPAIETENQKKAREDIEQLFKGMQRSQPLKKKKLKGRLLFISSSRIVAPATLWNSQILGGGFL